MARKFARKMGGRLKFRDGDAGGERPVSSWGLSHSLLRPNTTGIDVDEVMSLNLAAMWRAVSVKAGDLAKLPLDVHERLASGGSHPDRTSSVYELLSYPNNTRSGRKQRHTAAVHLMLWGNSYQEIIRDLETGDPERLELLDPRYVEPRRGDQNQLLYWLRGTKSPWSGKKAILPENMIHFSGLSLDGDSGLNPVRSGGNPFSIAMSLDMYAGSLWGNGAIPNGVIECPAEWGEDARINFRTSWREVHGGVLKANNVAILEEGAKWVATSLNPEQLQMLASREFSVIEIARIVGIPPHKLFDMSHDVQRSLEEMNLDYYETEIDPITQMMADEYALKLFTASDRKHWYVAFDTTRLMLGTSLTRAQTNQIKFQNGIMTANQWRAEDGDNPFETDLRVVPLNMKQIPTDTDLDPDPAGDSPADPEPLPKGLSDESRKVLRECLGRMTRREIKRVRENLGKDHFGPAWLADDYAKFTPIFREAVEPALSLHTRAMGLTVDVSALVVNLLRSSVEALTGADDPAAVLDDWEAHKVDRVIATVEATP